MINKIAIVPYAEYGRTVMGKDNTIAITEEGLPEILTLPGFTWEE